MNMRIGVLLIALGFCLQANAEEHHVKMLNFGTDGGMVFEPGFIQINPGDSITFVPENTGHHVKSHSVPTGASPWQSELDEPFTVTLDQEGVYVYYCPPHLMMNMVGVIQVGEQANADSRDEVTEQAEQLGRRAFQNSARLGNLMQQITWSE